MYRKTYKAKQLQRKRAWSRNAVAAKARKRLAQDAELVDVGGLTTDGCLGRHTIRLLAYPEDTLALAVVVDGEHRRPRTQRGVWKCISAIIARRTK